MSLKDGASDFGCGMGFGVVLGGALVLDCMWAFRVGMWEVEKA